MEDALANMKQNTRSYARRQVKWMRNKLIPAIDAANHNSPENESLPISLFLLDTTGMI